MSTKTLSFADVLIILAIVLLLAALAIPQFVKAPDFGNEVDEDTVATSNLVQGASSPTNGADNASAEEAP